ncbi:hypothetical protein BHM03_00043643 [Ensete ventricosum]|nr:hypothetical protein BHM03_00043643 [Ensete ventricosum]
MKTNVGACHDWCLVEFREPRKKKKKKKKKSTSNVMVDRGVFLVDSHWLRLMESPTNIIFLPFNLPSISCPLNLHNITPIRFNLTLDPNSVVASDSHNTRERRRPREFAGVGLPPVLEVRLVRPAVPLAVELRLQEGAGGGVVERVRVVVDPAPLEHVAADTARSLPPPGRRAIAAVVLVTEALRRHAIQGGNQNPEQRAAEPKAPLSFGSHITQTKRKKTEMMRGRERERERERVRL